ncbi:MAG: hypothetical protein K6A65_01220 [Succinivibrionaceae bacterium]|nr:hypothetical protein [Succinivibrionaceae bacterium]
MLQDLVKAYYRHLGGSEDYIEGIEGEDGIYTLSIGQGSICTISESRTNREGKLKICLLATLDSELTPEGVLKGFAHYGPRLRLTPLYLRAYLVTSEDLALGLSYEIDAEGATEESFPHTMDLFAATVISLLSGEPGEGQEPDHDQEEAIAGLFVPVPDDGYREFLGKVNLDEEALDGNLGILEVHEGFATKMRYHDLSGLVFLENSFACADQQVLIDLLYLNGINPYISSFDYRDGALRLVSAIDPAHSGQEEFHDALLTQDFLCEKTNAYIKDESRHVAELSPDEILHAIFA